MGIGLVDRNGVEIKPGVPKKKQKMTRRIRRVPFDPRIFFMVFQTGTKKVVVDGFPKDSVFMGVTWDAPTMKFNMYIAHKTFDEVPEGEVIPELFPHASIEVEDEVATEVATEVETEINSEVQ